jgi:hypothetical protein
VGGGLGYGMIKSHALTIFFGFRRRKTMATAITDRRLALDAEVLTGIRRRLEEVLAEWAAVPEWERRYSRLEGGNFFMIEERWIPCRLALILPTADRAKRQRAADSLRRLASAGRIKLSYRSSGRVDYVRLTTDVNHGTAAASEHFDA